MAKELAEGDVLESSDTSVVQTNEIALEPPTAKGFMRDPHDWVMLAGVLAFTHSLGLLCVDWWFRTDLKFFPLAFIASAIAVFLVCKWGVHQSKVRHYFVLVLLVFALLAGISAVVIDSPWFGSLGLLLVVTGWLLHRQGGSRWYKIVAGLLPLWFLLALPLGDSQDWTRTLEMTTASSTSSLLDLLSVPQMATGTILEIQSGRIPASAVCREVANPYLAMFMCLLLMLVTKRTLAVGAITMLIAPFLIWVTTVSHLTTSIFLLQEHGHNILGGWVNIGCQTAFLMLFLLTAWLFSRAIRQLLAPFESQSYSADSQGIFNTIVLWPALDPVDRPGVKSPAASNPAPTLEFSNLYQTRLKWVLLALSLGLLIPGVLLGLQVMPSWGKMQPVQSSNSQVESIFTEDGLPPEVGEMSRVGFELVHVPGSPFSQRHLLAWQYAAMDENIQIMMDLPVRGTLPNVPEFLNKNAKLEPQPSMVDEVRGFSVDEAIVLDPLQGRTYILQTHLVVSDADSRLFETSLASAFRLHPTVARIRMRIDGVGDLDAEQVMMYRNHFMDICGMLKTPIVSLAD